MTVIFIDIDGVFNAYTTKSINTEGNVGNLNVDEDKVKLFSKIVGSTDIQLIMHSGWRFFYNDLMNPISQKSEELSKMFLRYGIEISGKTPDYSTAEIRQNKKFSLVKATEIRAWLVQHPEFDNYLVIDDLDLHDEELRQHQIRPDPTLGITEYDIDNIIKYLSNLK